MKSETLKKVIEAQNKISQAANLLREAAEDSFTDNNDKSCLRAFASQLSTFLMSDKGTSGLLSFSMSKFSKGGKG